MFQANEQIDAFFKADKAARNMRGCDGKAWATNVPCCTLITGAPLSAWRYVPNDMVLEILLSRQGFDQFPIPQEIVVDSPDFALSSAAFEWGRRYKKFGYFLEKPGTPGYGNIYKRTPVWEDRPDGASKGSWNSHWLKDCLPALDLVEYWIEGGCDGHTEYYRAGHAVVPHKLWDTGDQSPYGKSKAENYPYSVGSILHPYPSDEESVRKAVGMLSEFVQPVHIDKIGISTASDHIKSRIV